MIIRKMTTADIPRLEEIYAYARQFMRDNGNPNQWMDYWPDRQAIDEDIEFGTGYVIEDEGHICGYFAFIAGHDETYDIIEDGQWLNDEPYGVIHRIAGDGSRRGILEAALEFCDEKMAVERSRETDKSDQKTAYKGCTSNLRIDTHEDNTIMQHLLEKNGFIRCGLIYTHDGSQRLAYHRVKY